MDIKDYATIWVVRHIPVTDLYDDNIRKYVMELVETIIKQKHSGASFSATLSYLFRLFDDYRNQIEP